jgi:hypothetical protein
MWYRRLAVLFGLLCGLAGTQAPEFAQQYSQRLGGALDEVRRILTEFDAESAHLGLDRSKGVARLEADPDVLAKERGSEILRLQAREADLSEQLRALRNGGPVDRMFVLARDFDPGVAEQTARYFIPAVPVTPESAATGFLGFLLGLGILHGAAWPVRRRLLARRRAAAQSL